MSAASSAFTRPLPSAGGESGKQPFDKATARYCHVIVRTDLPLEQQAVQAIHAAMAVAAAHGGIEPDTRLALLAIPDQAGLMAWSSRLARAGIAFELFDEPDHGIGVSALATAPGRLNERRCLRRLPLWSGCTPASERPSCAHEQITRSVGPPLARA